MKLEENDTSRTSLVEIFLTFFYIYKSYCIFRHRDIYISILPLLESFCKVKRFPGGRIANALAKGTLTENVESS